MVRDMISALPDEMLLRVLSYLPTKQVVATSVLSKRWRFLWHSVSSFDFDFDGHAPLNFSKEAYLGFVQSVCKVLNSGDSHRPIQRFRLRCNSSFYDATDFNTFINVAVHRRVEHLDFSLFSSKHSAISIPSCTTLVSLKLKNLHLNVPSSINFPSLKILHLNRVDFPEHAHLAELLSGSPIIDDFTVKYLSFHVLSKEKPYKSFTKLVKACIISSHITFEAIKYAKFLRIDWAKLNSEELIPLFPNLTHLQYVYAIERPELLFKMLKHSPKLEFLSMDKDYNCGTSAREMARTYPESVPDCISSQLRTCRFNYYVGSESEFQLAVYIMENATRLQSMTIHTKPSFKEPEKLLLRFSMCTRGSSSCKLLMYGTPSGGSKGSFDPNFLKLFSVFKNKKQKTRFNIRVFENSF